MTMLERVRRVAASLQLLDTSGALRPLDSLSIVDFVDALEHEVAISIPTEALGVKAFKTLETVSELLDRLARSA